VYQHAGPSSFGSVLQRVAVCCSVLECVVVCFAEYEGVSVYEHADLSSLCSVLQCVVVWCSVSQCVAVR